MGIETQLINLESQNLSLNINLSSWNSTFINRECYGSQFFNVECLHKYFCPQLRAYFINVGIILVILTIIITWLSDWFFKSGYKLVEYKKNSMIGRFIGDLERKETRAYWDSYIRHYLLIAFMFYTLIVIYLNI